MTAAHRLPLLLLPLITTWPGCGEPVDLEQAPADGSAPHVIGDWEMAFEVADFIKPRRSADMPVPYYLTPLMHRSVPAGDAYPEAFGALTRRGAGTLALAADTPTLYYLRATTGFEGRSCPQLTFLWCLEVASTGDVRTQGVRLTLDDDGFPMAVQILGGPARGSREIHVVPGRLGGLTAERLVAGAEALDDEARPDPVRAHVLAEGPMATGPVLYLHPDEGTVAAIRCRCDPSPVRTVRRTIQYVVVPWPADVAVPLP